MASLFGSDNLPFLVPPVQTLEFPSRDALEEALLDRITTTGDPSLIAQTEPLNPCGNPRLIGLTHQGIFHALVYQDIPRDTPDRMLRYYRTWDKLADSLPHKE